MAESASELLTWLTTSDVAGLLGTTERTVQRQLYRGIYKVKGREGRGRGGRVHLIALESLPQDAQRRYLEKMIAAKENTQAAASEPEPVAPNEAEENQASPPERIRTVAELVAKYGRERADEILSKAASDWEEMVKAALEIKYDRQKRKTERCKELAARHGISLTTLYRKRDEYEREGILGLVDERYRLPEGGLEGKMRRSIDDEALRWIKARCLMVPPPTTAHVYRELCELAPQKGWRLPSRATVYRVVEDILAAELKMGQRGVKEYEAEMMPKVKRDYTHLLAMEEIVGDGHTFDLFVEWQGRAVRPELSAWEDMRTRKIVGWCIAPQTNSETIALALRHAIMTHGLAARIYVDNGKDYLSHYIKDVCSRLKIDIRNCIPRTPRAKMIERFFRTVHDQFTRYLPGYCGNKPENRPPGFDEKKLLKQGKLIPLEKFVELWAVWVEKYNNQDHSSLGDTPANVFAEVPHARPGRVDTRDLDVLMMRRENVRVQQGYIRLLGRDYWSHDIDLGRLVGEKVQVWYDFNRAGEVLIWYKGKFIGTAQNRKALEHGSDRAELAAELKAARAVRRAVKQQIASYVDGLEDVLPEEVVKKARRARRYYSPTEEKSSQLEDKVTRIIGHERMARQAREMMGKSDFDDNDPTPQRKYSRAEKMLLARGDRILAES